MLYNFFEKVDQCITRKTQENFLVIRCDANSNLALNRIKPKITMQKRFIDNFGLFHRNKFGVRFNTYIEINVPVTFTTYF